MSRLITDIVFTLIFPLIVDDVLFYDEIYMVYRKKKDIYGDFVPCKMPTNTVVDRIYNHIEANNTTDEVLPSLCISNFANS